MLLVLFGLAAIEFPAHGKLNDDSLGQFTNAPAFTATGTPISAEQISYGYDPGWNLNTRTINGSAQSFPVNDRNQNTGTPYGTPVYDGNGNMTQRGDHRFEYNAENQLIRLYQDYMGTLWKRFDFVYDGLGRKKRTIEYSWSLGSWNYMTETRYVYDGRRVIQERNSSNVPTVAYSRGLDLSQSLEGAGGIGGLLARSHGYSGGSWGTHNYYHADGGGNITALVNSSQTIVASYKYDSFGRTLSLSGSMATPNVYRFSSKEIEPNTGYYDYGFRFYDPLAQRWLNRDPIEEWGGINIYGYVFNAPVNLYDPDGRIVPIIVGGIAVGGGIYAGAQWFLGMYDNYLNQQLTDLYKDDVDKMIDADPNDFDPDAMQKKRQQIVCLGAASAGNLSRTPGTFNNGPPSPSLPPFTVKPSHFSAAPAANLTGRPGYQRVGGYVKRNGTYVPPYYRRNPGSSMPPPDNNLYPRGN
jgi:RHS repeat-associated protein